jgi:hypothetical protein
MGGREDIHGSSFKILRARSSLWQSLKPYWHLLNVEMVVAMTSFTA